MPESILEPTFADMLVTQAAAQEAHKRVCTLPVCQTCKRYVCPSCRATHGAGRGLCNPCRDRSNLSQVLSTLPEFAEETTFESEHLLNLIPRDVLSGIRAAIHEPSITIGGPLGSGKTSVACALLREAAIEGKLEGGYVFVTSFALSRATSTAKLGKVPQIIKDVLAASVVVIDELGAESDRKESWVLEVIHERHSKPRTKRTWCTTGLKAEDLAARYGGLIFRRALQEARLFSLPGAPKP